MSLALFHEFSGTQQSVGASLSGNFTAKDATEFVLLQGHRLLILRESQEESSSLRYVYFFNALVAQSCDAKLGIEIYGFRRLIRELIYT